jgi:hypothetical protein
MELKKSVVHRNLDSKIKILGFELYDLLALLIFASIMNLFFGNTSVSFVFVFVVPSLLGLALYFGKKNKLDNFLVHVFRYYLLPGIYFPGSPSQIEEKIKGRIYE